MRETVFPEMKNLQFPSGTLARINEAARQDGTTAAEFIRRAVRSALPAPSSNGREAEVGQ